MLSNSGVNISGQYLQTNEFIGYVVVDFDFSDDFNIAELDALKQIDGTLRARILSH